MSQRTIVEERKQNVLVMDVQSRLIQDRIIFIDDIISDELANGVIAQMLYLNSIDPKKQINIYINSPGGNVISGLAIYDVSRLITCKVRTVCVGLAASMAAILMLMGEERCGLPHSRFMLHQLHGGAIGSVKEAEISVEVMKGLQEDIHKILKGKTNIKNLESELWFDKWFTSQEALENGLINKIL